MWRYCEASARHIFGYTVGNALVADKILFALRKESRGLTRTQIGEVFGRNRSESESYPSATVLCRAQAR